MKKVDMFMFPGIGRFVGGAELALKLIELQPLAVSQSMQKFGKLRRAAGVAAWRDVLKAAEQLKAEVNVEYLPQRNSK